jgi:hypothetical protein
MIIHPADHSTEQLVKIMSSRGFTRQLGAIAFARSPVKSSSIQSILSIFSSFTTDSSFVLARGPQSGTWIFAGSVDEVRAKIAAALEAAQNGKPKSKAVLVRQLFPVLSELRKKRNFDLSIPQSILSPTLSSIRAENPYAHGYRISQSIKKLHRIVFQPGMTEEIFNQALDLTRIEQVMNQ